MLNFQRAKDRQPWELFELHIGTVPTGIYFPSKELYEFLAEDTDICMAHYGMDLEMESLANVFDALISQYDANPTLPAFSQPVFGGILSSRTKMELAVAFHAIRLELPAAAKHAIKG